ncbi:MAG: hypothetical protein BWY72_02513 [Bacteroidetes bacterium ADurb.Bin416]|nr:MAG: hypothetical protein BWY72_02513 [Bacteroidetes bacterium ADurb.Bin416]
MKPAIVVILFEDFQPAIDITLQLTGRNHIRHDWVMSKRGQCFSARV